MKIAQLIVGKFSTTQNTSHDQKLKTHCIFNYSSILITVETLKRNAHVIPRPETDCLTATILATVTIHC